MIINCFRKIFSILMLVCFAIRVVIPVYAYSNEHANSNDSIVFSDPNFESVVRKALNKPMGDILQSDVASVTSLNAAGNNIVSLEGIENFRNLKELYISNNKLTDLDPLKGLEQITSLYAAGNSISRLDPLCNLTSLTTLNLKGNEISDISKISNLNKLIALDLSDNMLVDISSLEGLTNLVELRLSRNFLVNYSPIGKLTHITTLELNSDKDHTKLDNLSILSGLPCLLYLYLDGNNIGDLSQLSDFPNLKGLHLCDNLITCIEPLSRLKALTELYLDGNNISDIATVGGLTELVSLSLERVGISDISMVRGLKNLKLLYLGNNKISDIAPVSSLQEDKKAGVAGLRQLHLHDNNITDVLVLKKITTLIEVDLGNNSKLEEVWPLFSLINLKFLYLENDATDLSAKESGQFLHPMNNLTKLEELDVSGNKITEINSKMVKLSNLRKLYINYNYISDISVLWFMNSLKFLRLSHNPIRTVDLPVYTTDSKRYITVTDYLPVEGYYDNLLEKDFEYEYVKASFSDPVLEKCIRDYICKPVGDIRRVDLRGINRLNLSGRGIQRLEGLDYAVDLTELDISNNKIEDLSPITELNPSVNFRTGLYNLQILNASNNQIKDIGCFDKYFKLRDPDDFIKGFEPPDFTSLDLSSNRIMDIGGLYRAKKLQSLNLSGNSISGISVFTELTELKRLDLSRNRIEDLNPLRFCVKLNELYLSNNQISDVYPLKALTLIINIDLHGNQIVDIAGVSGLYNLKYMDLSGNLIEDCSPLKALSSNLQILHLSGNRITEISGLEKLLKLKELYLQDNEKVTNGGIRQHISDITPLGSLNSLAILSISGAELYGGVEPLKNLKSLTGLDMSWCTCPDISPLGELPALKELNMSGNGISDISSLSKLTTLTKLDLRSNAITNLESVSTLKSIVELDVADNKIADITPLGKLTNLLVLSLSRNEVDDISILSSLKKLKKLYLDSNKLSGIAAVENLTNLISLTLSGNKITDFSPVEGFYLNLVERDFTYDMPAAGFKDPKLEKVIRDVLNKPEGMLYELDVERLETLDASGKGIEDITGLEKLTGLKSLNLSNNCITDAQPVAGLKKLTSLNLSGNLLKGIPIDNCTELKWLDLSNNKISNIEPLERCIQLEKLHLQNNAIQKIDPVAKLKKLRELDLGKNLISVISPVKSLIMLTSLKINDNKISDISCLSGLRGLKTLYLSGNEISHHAAIAAFYNSITDKDFELILPIRVNVKTQEVKFINYPVTLNKVIFIQPEPVGMAMGAIIKWDAKKHVLNIMKGRTSISWKLGSRYAYVGGKKTDMKKPVKLINKVVYVPVQGFGKLLGYKYSYDKTSRVVSYN